MDVNCPLQRFVIHRSTRPKRLGLSFGAGRGLQPVRNVFSRSIFIYRDSEEAGCKPAPAKASETRKFIFALPQLS